MIKVDIFSGRVYTETGNFKQSDNGDTFTKCGDTWFGKNGEVIKQTETDCFNLKTGVRSTFGDPFKETK
jgi:flagellar basal body rod protein FlgG